MNLPPKNLRQSLHNINNLPALPRIAREVLALKINTIEGEKELLKLIEKDPSIMSRIVGMSNSPMFGTDREILTLHDAAKLLGSKRVKMVALSFAMMSSTTSKSAGLLNIQNLWQHSLIVTMTMDTLASFMPSEQRPSDDEIYLAGLLHDIGFLLLDYLDIELSNQFHARLKAEPGCTVEEIEVEMLELNHCELGAELGKHWNLPKPIITVLRDHHITNDGTSPRPPLVALTNLAEKLLPTFGITETVQSDIAPEEWLSLGIDPSKADEIMTKVQKHANEVRANYS